MFVLDTIFPLFAVIALGFVTVRTGYLSATVVRPVGELVIRVALPALIFQALTSTPIEEALEPSFIAGYALASLTVFAGAFAVFRARFHGDTASAGLAALGTSASNSGYIGYAIAAAVIGPPAATMLAQCMVVENLMVIPLALSLMAGRDGLGRLAVLKRTAVSLARNPLIIAMAAGLLVAIAGIELAAPIRQPIEMLARVSSPVALFVVGGTLASLKAGRIAGDAALIVGTKLIAHPLATFAALSVMPGLDARTILGGVLFACAPMISIYPIFGQGTRLEQTTAAALLAATVASFLTLSAVLWAIG